MFELSMQPITPSAISERLGMSRRSSAAQICQSARPSARLMVHAHKVERKTSISLPSIRMTYLYDSYESYARGPDSCRLFRVTPPKSHSILFCNPLNARSICRSCTALAFLSQPRPLAWRRRGRFHVGAHRDWRVDGDGRGGGDRDGRWCCCGCGCRRRRGRGRRNRHRHRVISWCRSRCGSRGGGRGRAQEPGRRQWWDSPFLKSQPLRQRVQDHKLMSDVRTAQNKFGPSICSKVVYGSYVTGNNNVFNAFHAANAPRICLLNEHI